MITHGQSNGSIGTRQKRDPFSRFSTGKVAHWVKDDLFDTSTDCISPQPGIGHGRVSGACPFAGAPLNDILGISPVRCNGPGPMNEPAKHVGGITAMQASSAN